MDPDVRKVLTAAGWHPDWDASPNLGTWAGELGPRFTLSPAAESALRRYGGLQVQQSGAGEECARESFDLNPLFAAGEEDRFRSHEETLGVSLYPVGEAGGGHVFLAVAADGRVFALMEDLWHIADGMEEALESLVRGRRPRLIT